MFKRAFEIAENAFEELKMWFAGGVHEQAYLLYCVSEIGARESEVLQRSGKAAIKSAIV